MNDYEPFQRVVTNDIYPALERCSAKHKISMTALFILNYLPSHSTNWSDLFYNVIVEYIPKSTVSFLQLKDQGLKANFKAYYMRNVRQLMKPIDKEDKLAVRDF